MYSLSRIWLSMARFIFHGRSIPLKKEYVKVTLQRLERNALPPRSAFRSRRCRVTFTYSFFNGMLLPWKIKRAMESHIRLSEYIHDLRVGRLGRCVSSR